MLVPPWRALALTKKSSRLLISRWSLAKSAGLTTIFDSLTASTLDILYNRLFVVLHLGQNKIHLFRYINLIADCLQDVMVNNSGHFSLKPSYQMFLLGIGFSF